MAKTTMLAIAAGLSLLFAAAAPATADVPGGPGGPVGPGGPGAGPQPPAASETDSDASATSTTATDDTTGTDSTLSDLEQSFADLVSALGGTSDSTTFASFVQNLADELAGGTGTGYVVDTTL